MSNKLIELLKTSSLRSMLSDSEIDEVYEELRGDFDDFLEEETERITEEIKETSKIEDLEDDIKDLKKEINKISNNGLPNKTLVDTMTFDWVKDNWEGVVKLYNLNKAPKEIINLYQYGETLIEMGREGAPEISKMMDAQILKDVMALGNNTEQLEHATVKDTGMFTRTVTIVRTGEISDGGFIKEPQPDMEQMIASIHPEVQKEADSMAIMHDKFMEQQTNRPRFILVGRAASGKDHMRKQLEKAGYVYAVSYTTRPPRTGEVEGKDYFFLSEEEFKRMIDNNEFYEHVSFNNWHYGTSNAQFYNDDIFIMTPHGLSCVKPEDRKNSFVVFFDMKEGVRRRRLMERSDADSVDRRLIADNLDFEGFKDFDIKITNHDF